jgi:site-specific recombinase XerD
MFLYARYACTATYVRPTMARTKTATAPTKNSSMRGRVSRVKEVDRGPPKTLHFWPPISEHYRASELDIIVGMTSNLELTVAAPTPVSLPANQMSAADYAQAAFSQNTRRAYRSDLADFKDWCERMGVSFFPASPEAICNYITDLVNHGAKVSTIERRLSALSQVHRSRGIEPPPTWDWAVKQAMAGIRRTHGVAPEQKTPLDTTEVLRLLEATPILDSKGRSRLAGIRDRALILLHFACASRSSEVGSFCVEDLTPTSQGYRLRLARSKTDQEGEGQYKAIPYGTQLESCPVRALNTWLVASGINEGPLFRQVNRHGQVSKERLSGQAVTQLVQRACRRAGLNPKRYGGHSLRAGHITSAAVRGAHNREIKRQTGHLSDRVVDGYVRPATIFENNSVTKLGL